jgi:FolB domain-containing protein
MDYIHIDKLVFRGKHGYFAKERRVEQEFALSVKLGVDIAKAGQSDNLADTINYIEVRNTIQSVIEGGSKFLIETLAEEIAQKVLEDKRIQTVELTIQKPEVWHNGVPGVTIVRSK